MDEQLTTTTETSSVAIRVTKKELNLILTVLKNAADKCAFYADNKKYGADTSTLLQSAADEYKKLYESLTPTNL